jgi:pentatricopeptide repeat protein
MRLRSSIYAALVGSTLAWTNPLLTKNAAEIVRQAATRQATSAAIVDIDDDTVASLFNVNDKMLDMLESAQLSSSVCLEEMTKILLDRDAHPPGSLSWDVLDAAFPVLNAWAKTHTEVGAQTAENILERLQLEENSSRKQLVTAKHYGVVVDAWAKSNHPQAAQRAEFILNKMKSPNRVAYNAVMSAWARQGNVKEALRLLQKMPSCTTQDYNTLLAAHAKCGNAREAESLLNDMMSSEHDVVPDIVSYNCVLDAWAKSRDEGAAERALVLLQSLPEADARSFSCVASAFVKKGNVDQVQSLLAEAQDRGIEMDAYLQNTLLEAFAMRGEATRAQQYLDQMEQEGLANSVSYNTVIKAWKRSGASDAAQQAEKILDCMAAQQLDDVFTYTSVVSYLFAGELLSLNMLLMSLCCR